MSMCEKTIKNQRDGCRIAYWFVYHPSLLVLKGIGAMTTVRFLKTQVSHRIAVMATIRSSGYATTLQARIHTQMYLTVRSFEISRDDPEQGLHHILLFGSHP